MIGRLMSSFKRKEPLIAGARRMTCDHLEATIHALSRKGQGAAALKSLLQTQASLMLVTSMLRDEDARRDQALLAEVLNTMQAAQVGRLLKQRYSDLLAQAGLSSDTPDIKLLRSELLAGMPPNLSLNAKTGSFNPVVYRMVADLAELRGHTGHWPDGPDDLILSPPGLGHAYRLARRLLSKSDLAALGPTPMNRIAQTLTLLANQMACVAKTCAPMIKPHRKILLDAAQAAEQGMIDRTIDDLLKSRPTDTPAPLVQALEDARAKNLALLAQSGALGLAEAPAAFDRRIGAYWQHWRCG